VTTTADAILKAIGQATLNSIGAKGITIFESGSGLSFSFKGSPSGGNQLTVTGDDGEAPYRVGLARVTPSHPAGKPIQGKRGVLPDALGRVILELSRHGK
jgi:hypothetical protein